MSTFAWILFGGFELLLLLGAFRARQLWRDETSVFDGQPVERLITYPLMAVSGALAVPCIMVTGVLRPDEADGIAVVPLVAALVVIGIAIGSTWLKSRVRRTGQPEWVIPPHLREEARRRATKPERRGAKAS